MLHFSKLLVSRLRIDAFSELLLVPQQLRCKVRRHAEHLRGVRESLLDDHFSGERGQRTWRMSRRRRRRSLGSAKICEDPSTYGDRDAALRRRDLLGRDTINGGTGEIKGQR